MSKSNGILRVVPLCFALLAAACGDDASPTAPTATAPRLTGTWSGSFQGQVISSQRFSTTLEQGDGSHGERTNVDGTWSATVRLPPVPGAPAEVELGGPVRGDATGGAAELTFEIEGFPEYFPEGCGIAADVTFDATTMNATWETNDMCQPPAVDEGTLTMMRQ